MKNRNCWISNDGRNPEKLQMENIIVEVKDKSKFVTKVRCNDSKMDRGEQYQF